MFNLSAFDKIMIALSNLKYGHENLVKKLIFTLMYPQWIA